jgi:hypothetical protein
VTSILDLLTDAVMERYWSKVSIRGEQDCWEWTAACVTSGYGHFVVRGKHLNACHISLALAGRPRPADLHSLHSCDNRKCCNPAHLRWGTCAENMADRDARNRLPPRKGSANNLAKLTEESVRQIRSAAGIHREIAARFAVSRSTVSLIRANKIWTHV